MHTEIAVLADLDSFFAEAASRFQAAVTEAIDRSGRASISLSGGSTPKRLYQLLASAPLAAQLPWSQIHLFWGDERYVGPDHPDSNYRMVREALIDHVAIPAENVHPMPTHFADPEAAAVAYTSELQAFFKDGIRIDLALMGMGADGHTASLFPGDPALAEQARPVAVARPASQPTIRLTLTYPVFNRSHQVMFLVAGADKAATVAGVLEGNPAFPSQAIRPEDGSLVWLLDAAAGAKVTTD